MREADVAQAARDRIRRVAVLAGLPPHEADELVPLTDDETMRGVSVVVAGVGVFLCTRPVVHDGAHDNPAFWEAI